MTPVRRCTSVALGVALAVASLELAACFISGYPPDPHDTADDESLDFPDASAPDASDASVGPR